MCVLMYVNSVKLRIHVFTVTCYYCVHEKIDIVLMDFTSYILGEKKLA